MRGSKWALVAVVAILFIAAGSGLWWYIAVPHTPEAQFAYAQKLDKALRGDAATKSPKELQPQIDNTIDQYLRVGTRFGPGPKAAEALKQIAKLQEEVVKDPAKALATLDGLIKAYPDEPN